MFSATEVSDFGAIEAGQIGLSANLLRGRNRTHSARHLRAGDYSILADCTKVELRG
jgi:hypothetical protein